MTYLHCRISRPCSSRETSCDKNVSLPSLTSSALAASDCLPSVENISESEKMLEDSSRLSAWLNRLGLSSRLAEYTSLLRSVNPLSNSRSETTSSLPSAAVSMGAVFGSSDMACGASQDFPTCRSFVPRALPHVGLNSVMSMKRDFSKRPCSSTRQFLLNTSPTLPFCSKELITISSSAVPCDALSTSRTAASNSKVNLEKLPCFLSYADHSLELSKPAAKSLVDVTPDSESMFVLTSMAAAEASPGFSGHFLPVVSTEPLSELLSSATVPSVVVTPCVESVVCPTSATTVETDCGFCENFIGIVSASSLSNEGRKTSTPAKRPRSLDVIPWSPLSRSACTLTGSLTTVVHSHISSSSSSSSTAAEPIPAS